MGCYITMESSRVIEIAEKTLRVILEARAEELTRLLDEERRSKLNRFWWWLTQRSVPTDEELIERLKLGGDSLSDISMIDIMYGQQQDIAMRLLKAARLADEVIVSSDDLVRMVD